MDSIKAINIDVDVDGCEKLYDYGHSTYYHRPADGCWDLTALSREEQVYGDTRTKHSEKTDRIFHHSGFTEKELKEYDDSVVTCPIWGGLVGPRPQKLLQRTLPVLRPGDVVKGRVSLELNKPLHAENFMISMQGKAETLIRIHTRDGHHDSKGEHVYTSQEKMFWQKSESEELQAGNHTFNFEFTLPSHCPGSTPDLVPCDREDYAYIMYRLKAKITYRKLLTRNVVVIKGLWVEEPMDIAAQRTDINPMIMELSRETGIACCKNKTIFCTAKLGRRAFVRGEEIPITLEVENRTGRQINTVVAQVVLFVEYCSGTGAFADYRSREIKGRPIFADGIPPSQFRVIQIRVPLDFTDSLLDNNLIPTGTIRDCPIISVEYNLKITFKRPFWHRNVKILIPITLGNVDSRGATVEHEF